MRSAGETWNGVHPPGARYVAMGSFYAAGTGVTTLADTPPGRCQRSNDNYAHQLARKRGLNLVDVSCGGATTANVLHPATTPAWLASDAVLCVGGSWVVPKGVKDMEAPPKRAASLRE